MTPTEEKITEYLMEIGVFSPYKTGWPDLLVNINGQPVAIEIKSKTDDLRENQSQMIRRLSYAIEVRVIRECGDLVKKGRSFVTQDGTLFAEQRFRNGKEIPLTEEEEIKWQLDINRYISRGMK